MKIHRAGHECGFIVSFPFPRSTGLVNRMRCIRLFLVLVSVVSFALLGDSIFAQDLPEDSPSANLFKNPDFELGWTGWGGQGGDVGVEDCCGQHETPFWGRDPNSSPYGGVLWETQKKNAYLIPNGKFTQLYQWVSVSESRRYRFSVWLFTNGMTATVSYYSPTTDSYTDCGSTNSTVMVLIACEFRAAATEEMAFTVDGKDVAGKWIVTDNWALTRIGKPPRWPEFPLWSSLPVKYYVDSNGYPTRTDIAATRWNNGVGKQVLQKTSDPSQAQIKFTAGYRGILDNNGDPTYFAQTRTPVNGVATIDVNKSWLDVWKEYRYGFEAREAVLGHEFGHALGLAHTTIQSCNMMAADGTEVDWFCSTSSPTWGEKQKIKNMYP